MRWVDHAPGKGKQRLRVEYERGHFVDPEIDERIILKFILKYEVKIASRFK